MALLHALSLDWKLLEKQRSVKAFVACSSRGVMGSISVRGHIPPAHLHSSLSLSQMLRGLCWSGAGPLPAATSPSGRLAVGCTAPAGLFGEHYASSPRTRTCRHPNAKKSRLIKIHHIVVNCSSSFPSEAPRQSASSPGEARGARAVSPR